MCVCALCAQSSEEGVGSSGAEVAYSFKPLHEC